MTYIPTAVGFRAPPRVTATLTPNADGTFTFMTGNQLSYSFDDLGALTSITDLNGYTVTLSHPNSYTIVATDSAGRTLTLDLTGDKVTSATDPDGNTTDYTYDSAGDLVSVTDPAGDVTTFSYDNSHRLTGVTDPRGNTATNHYDAQGRVDQQTDRRGNATTFDYDSIADATEVTDPVGDVTVDYYTDGLMTKRTIGYGTADASTTSYQYDPISGGAEQVTDPNGNVTTKTYDGNGNVLTSTDALGNTTTYTYNSFNEPTSVTDPLGITTISSYDSSGNLLSVSTPITGGGNVTSTYTYGSGAAAGDVVTSTDPDGNTTSYGYDAAGDLTSSTDALGNETTATYDDNGRVLTTTTPNGHTTSYAYDDDGRVTTVRDPQWDASDPSQHETVTVYDPDGNVASVTDGGGNITTHYNARGQRVSSTDPLGQVTHYSYDAAGNLTLTAAPGATCAGASPSAGCTVFSYDADNRLTGRSWADGATHAVTFSYDADGRRSGMSDATGGSSFGFDSMGRLTSVTDGHGVSTGYGYDLAGNLTSLTYPGTGHTVTRGFDDDNRLDSVTDWNNNTTTFGYNPDGQVNQTTFPSGTGEIDWAGFNASGQPTSMTDYQGQTLLAGFTYGYNGVGQVVTATTTGIGNPDQAYAYNSLGELNRSGPSSDPTSYGYNRADDMLYRASTANTAITQSFNHDSQLCWTSPTYLAAHPCANPPAGATSYTYNSAGDRTTGTPPTGDPSSYSYDEADQLTGYTGPNAASVSYTYDGAGLRASTTTSTGTSYDTWNQARPVPLLVSDGSDYFVYGPGGTPIEQISVATGTITYLHADQTGSIRLLTDTTGALVGTYSYDPWGKIIGHTGTASTPLQYHGQYTDPATGLIYLRHRYYDPTTAQFLTRDPALDLTGQPYTYANNDPLNHHDPLGLWSWNPIDDKPKPCD